MIIGIQNDEFFAAATAVYFPGGQVITRDNLPAGWREVEPPADPAEQEPAPIPHTPGQWVERGQAVIHEGVTYTARQRHLMQADWLPPLLALWLRVNDGEDWVPGEQVWAANDPNHPTEPNANVATVRVYEGVRYTVLQSHVTQAGWEPPNAQALWQAEAGEEPGVAAWVQGGGTGTSGSYNLNDEVTHDNPNDGGAIWLYRSAIAANTTEPGRDSTFDRWWTPLEPVA
jgi:hypothetical protein